MKKQKNGGNYCEYKCRHIIPSVTKQILKDLVNLKILSPQYVKDFDKLEEIFNRDDILEKSDFNYCFSEYRHSYKVSGNSVSYKDDLCNIHELSHESLNFLLSLNHKQMEINKLGSNYFDYYI